MSEDGDYVCPESLPGEAAVHRVEARPAVLPKSGSNRLLQVVKGLLAFTAGRVAGDVLFGGAPNPVQMQPLPPGTSPVEQAAAYFQSRQGG